MELKREIEQLKTQIASIEAGTVEEEKIVATKLENDPDMLESFFALQMEVEELRKIEDTNDALKGEVAVLEEKLAVSQTAKIDLENKINCTLEEIKNASNEELKSHLEAM